ncbi:tail fiber domain-containing protein [Maribacter dokdonensis]|uniref:tail fiber domain-containing protein n=1 Tax=Maribacter dokdonensis TaxID=320912 RepID=UPI0007199A2B|nr:tail fiber domain-containing protein [Maribacter dokdonensis]KSA14462.1 Collagen triple helix repeat-containing protein [Maribacter dokdonensis DSW-8]
MKRNYVSVLVIVAMMCGSFILNAQQKNYINYQGVVRDADNELLVEESVEIGIALKFGAANAPIQYKESHFISTDINGVFSLQIGSGINISGNYENLPWDEASFVTVSFNGSELGTTELMAVPYAITSGSDQWIVDGNAIANKNIGEVRITEDLQVFGEFTLNDSNAVNEISDDGTLLDNSSTILPTQKAVKTYVDSRIVGGGESQNAQEVPFNNLVSGLTAINVQDALDELVIAGIGDADDDTDSTNELQDISLSGTDLSISDGSTINLSSIIPPGGTDDQNAFEVPFDNTGTGLAAADTQAAIAELAADGLVDTDDQDLSLSGTTLQITDGASVDLSTIIPPGGTDDQNASEVLFDNTGTGLAAADTQAAIAELAAGGLVDTDDQDLSLSGTTLQITDGSSVDLSTIIPPGGTDDQEASEVPFDNTGTGLAAADTQAAITELAAGGLVDTDDQALVMTGDVLSIEDGTGSVDLNDYVDVTGESGLLLGDGTNISGLEGTGDGQVAKWDGATNKWVAGTDEVGGGGGSSLWSENESDIYFDSGKVGVGLTDPNAIHHVHADSYQSNSLYTTDDTGNASNDGMYVGLVNDLGLGFTATISNQEDGPLILGTNGTNRLIITKEGYVGLGTASPIADLHISSTSTNPLILETSASDNWLSFENSNGYIGYAGIYNGDNDMDFGTGGGNTTGKVNLVTGASPKLTLIPNGNVGIGTINPTANLHLIGNSNLNKPLLKLEEEGNDYARLEFKNTESDAFWHMAAVGENGFGGERNSKVNFYFNNDQGAGNRMTITGDGRVGINTSNPSARLTIYQDGQAVGNGLSFSDGSLNEDWHITHGYGLRFHYGGTLKAFINASTGVYTVSSDRRLKTDIKPLPGVLDKVSLLKPSTYVYKSDTRTKTLGLVAQDVQPLFPELVSKSNDDGMLGVNYSGFSVVALRAIQEQQFIIEEQTEKISNLEERLRRLEAKIGK